MEPLPSLEGLNWWQVRALAKRFAALGTAEELARVAEEQLGAAEVVNRQFAVYLLGYTIKARPANLDVLRERVAPDASWEMQEALAQAFDEYCGAIGYKAALPTIDAWLADAHPNVRRAVTEGLRPWTSQRRAYFSKQPLEAIRRLAALRSDPSAYVRHSVGNALRDIRRFHQALVDAETATWNLDDPLEQFTYKHVLKAQKAQ